MFAHDQGWLRRMREAVLSGLTAEAAVERVQSDNRARMLRQTDPYLRERLHDLDDLANRLLHRLVGRDLVAQRGSLPDNAIIVARSMGPAALLDYDRSRLRGLVLEEGGPTSHIAIVARALGIPAVGEVANATSLVEPGDAIIVDGGGGDAQIRPRPDVEAAYAEKARLRARRMEQYRRLREVPAVTRDGVRDHPAAQCRAPRRPAASARDRRRRRRPLPHRAAVHGRRADALGGRAAGPLQGGLSRRRATCPSPSAPSTSAATRSCPTCRPWRRRIRRSAGAPSASASTGPALLRAQARALLKAAGGRPLRIMFPMVATCDEFVRAKAIVAARARLSPAPRPRIADRRAPRRDARGALAPLPDRGDLHERGFRLGRLERPDAVPLRGRPREPHGGEPLRSVERAVAARAAPHRRDGRGLRLPGHGLRRDRRAAARGDGADRARLPLAVDGADVDRSGQGDAARPRRRPAPQRDSRGAAALGRRRNPAAGALGLRREHRSRSDVDRHRRPTASPPSSRATTSSWRR